MVLAFKDQPKSKETIMTENLMNVSPSFCPATSDFLSIKFSTPDISIIQSAIAKSHASHHSGCVQGMHLVGESGTGKSYIVKDYAAQYPRYVENGQEIVPVLYVSLLQKSTTYSLIVRLLRTLTGSPNITGKEEALQFKLISRLIAAKSQFIIIDESQHLTRESSSILAQHSADAIKAIMDATGIPIMCVSIDKSLALLMGKSKFKKERQLKRRNRRMYSIQAYDLGSEYWSRLMEQYHAALNCQVNLNSEEMLKRMHIATSGLFGNLTPLIKEAIEITGCSEKIDMNILEKAYIEFQPENELGFNPFTATMSTIEAEITHRFNQSLEASAIQQG